MPVSAASAQTLMAASGPNVAPRAAAASLPQINAQRKALMARMMADPSNLDLESERSTQLVLGYSRHLREDLRFSAEGYYQKLDDLKF